MSAVLSIRIPRKLKEELKKLENIVDWRKEIVQFLEELVERYRRRRVLMELRKTLEKHPVLPPGSATKVVREDRDSH